MTDWDDETLAELDGMNPTEEVSMTIWFDSEWNLVREEDGVFFQRVREMGGKRLSEEWGGNGGKDGTVKKSLTPRNISATASVAGLRTIEDLFVERANRLLERELGPIFALNLSEMERRTRIENAIRDIMPRLEEEAVELITQAYTAAMEEEGIRALTPRDQRAIESILSLPDGLVPALRGIEDNIRQGMEQAIREEQAKPGFTLEGLVRRLREISGETQSRLERIARTETTRIANVSRETQWRKIGRDPNVREYEWIRAQDARVCPICAGIARKNPWTLTELKRETDKGFGAWVPHPGCRCTVVRNPNL